MVPKNALGDSGGRAAAGVQGGSHLGDDAASLIRGYPHPANTGKSARDRQRRVRAVTAGVHGPETADGLDGADGAHVLKCLEPCLPEFSCQHGTDVDGLFEGGHISTSRR